LEREIKFKRFIQADQVFGFGGNKRTGLHNFGAQASWEKDI
jgi:hypothetical protein